MWSVNVMHTDVTHKHTNAVDWEIMACESPAQTVLKGSLLEI